MKTSRSSAWCAGFVNKCGYLTTVYIMFSRDGCPYEVDIPHVCTWARTWSVYYVHMCHLHDLPEWSNICDLYDMFILTGMGSVLSARSAHIYRWVCMTCKICMICMICRICNIFGRWCVPEWDLGLCDLYIFTGWDLYDLHEQHMFRREGQIINQSKSSSKTSWRTTLYTRNAINNVPIQFNTYSN